MALVGGARLILSTSFRMCCCLLYVLFAHLVCTHKPTGHPSQILLDFCLQGHVTTGIAMIVLDPRVHRVRTAAFFTGNRKEWLGSDGWD